MSDKARELADKHATNEIGVDDISARIAAYRVEIQRECAQKPMEGRPKPNRLRMKLHEALLMELISAWEALPEGNDYPVDLIQAWLDKHMYPVVQSARALSAPEGK